MDFIVRHVFKCSKLLGGVLEDYHQRVIDEKTELDTKLEKLREFQTTTKFGSIPADEKNRLYRQEEVMAEYSKILGELIESF